MLVDTHCHLSDERLIGSVESIVNDMHSDGLSALITVGYDEESSVKSYEFARTYTDVYAAVGMHPHDSKDATNEMYDLFCDMAIDEKVVAIGEIGLDYHYDLSPREIQKRVFLEQLELAHSLEKPVILHVREAYEDARKILFDNRNLLSDGVLLHCYSGSPEYVKIFSKLDAYFSFGGAITFNNARHNIESLQCVPADRLLLETDAPYMTPVPYRGQTNFPKWVNLVCDKASQVLEIERENLAEITTKNAKSLFKRQF